MRQKISYLILILLILTGCGLIPDTMLPTEVVIRTYTPASPGSSGEGIVPTIDSTRLAAADIVFTATPPPDPRLLPSDIQLANSEIVSYNEAPHVPILYVRGNLPSECVQLRVEISKPDANKLIAVKAYGLIDPVKLCEEAAIPFERKLYLRISPPGIYALTLNGQQMGEVTYP